MRQIFSPPQFVNQSEKARHGEFLHYMTLTLMGILILLMLFNVLFDRFAVGVANIILFVLLLSQFIAYHMIHRGYVRETGTMLLLMGWIGMTWIAGRVEGLRDTAIFGLVVVLIGAGFLLGWRSVAFFTVLNIAAIWTLAFLERQGMFNPVLENPFRIALDLSAGFILISLEIFFLVNSLRKSIEQTDREYSERLLAEEKLLNEREQLALALSAAKMETWNWDIEKGTIIWSDGIEEMFGMEKNEFDGKYDTYLSLIHPDDVQLIQDSVGKALADENYGYVVEHRLIWPNGDIRWLEGRGKVYRDQYGKPIRMAGTVVDVTDRKTDEAERERLIQELAAKNTELEQFNYTVSHDLKAPIITIKGFLGFLADDARSGKQDRLERDITHINQAVDKMHRLLNELLELSRVGRMMNPSVEVPFRELVDEALTLIEGRLQSVDVQIKIAEDCPIVYGDRRRLLEVTQNLLDNAVKFSAGQTSPLVEVGWREGRDNDSVFFVRDNGIGIAPEHHSRIFDLFNKLDPMAEGTGVGLALVKRIVEFHGGSIWVESEAGMGSTFLFALPTQGPVD